ncbi:hypothetical protein [Nonomuraea sp. SYSU D8015]|uniref:hypothetical protein n=1 Tax=Nonomuraea sp. SYSU D8015 TaxID=2593644 RepID=UPI00166100EA|nr:hypothetical protein [Nonomuraea sp. SYSU D8015]
MPKVLIFPYQRPQSRVPDVRGLGWVARRALMMRASFKLERLEKGTSILIGQTFDGDERTKLKAQLQQIKADLRAIRKYASDGFPAIREV